MACGTCRYKYVVDDFPCSGCNHGRWWEEIKETKEPVLDEVAGLKARNDALQIKNLALEESLKRAEARVFILARHAKDALLHMCWNTEAKSDYNYRIVDSALKSFNEILGE